MEEIRKNRFQRIVRVTLDVPVDSVAGDRVLNARYAGAGFDISGNVLINNASRGINVNQSHGSVKGNYISHSYLPGIHMTEFMNADSGGSGFQTDVEIVGNVVTDACIGYPGRKDWQGAISIVAWDGGAGFVDGHSKIEIKGNTIETPNGIGIQVQCGSNISVQGNAFGSLAKAGDAREGKLAPAILLDSIHGGVVNHNALAGDGWKAPGAGLQVNPNCKEIKAESPLLPYVPEAAH